MKRVDYVVRVEGRDTIEGSFSADVEDERELEEIVRGEIESFDAFWKTVVERFRVELVRRKRLKGDS